MINIIDNIIPMSIIALLILYILFKNPFSCKKDEKGNKYYRYKYESEFVNKCGFTIEPNIEHIWAYGKDKDEACQYVKNKYKTQGIDCPNVIITRCDTEVKFMYFIPIITAVSALLIYFYGFPNYDLVYNLLVTIGYSLMVSGIAFTFYVFIRN